MKDYKLLAEEKYPLDLTEHTDQNTRAMVKKFNRYQIYKREAFLSGVECTKGEIERLKKLLENVFKGAEETCLDITEPRENIEISWQRFAKENNL